MLLNMEGEDRDKKNGLGMLGSTLVAHGKELLIWAAEWVLKTLK